MNVQDQYDEIGEAFEGFKSLPLMRYGEVPSFLGLVGDVTGKSVLDLACGTGFYSREFKRRGATEVFGVDISVEMIAAAREMDRRAPLGVVYEVGDVAELRQLDRRYDIALGVQCLNYAGDIAETERMCANIHRNLVSGGEFFLLVQTPDYRYDGPPLDKYGFRIEATGKEIETGSRGRLTALLDPQPITIITTCPRREVYERSLKAAGFSELEWVPLSVSEAGIREYGEEFWADMLSNPPLELLRCRA
ncbi:ToxA protein [Streptomyces venezuelae]|uniref:class I SAM-dependent methyltransferase n=1 Tax=Streptomyces gardneri TaxID=66892 RepID=UPI0006BD4428|nr:class I SAM-dependent methyltransferase [Streptomyces gardneri]ALO08368.1 ToxA protein [Streptomyces venezuelae]QPK45587.1 class I SAM-dependent methyltransferase [Streptomyces gardneri]WRK36931.1 class I SAM-dependent methyltransferase [Streptomyces venezuelae]CUM41277.1 Methyltransferase [Streptomyces venezuelae]